MVSRFVGIKYQLNSSDRFDEYLKAAGVGYLIRKMISSFTPIVELSDHGDGSLTLKSSTTVRSSALTFKLGEEFVQQTMDGRQVPTIVTLEGDNTLVEVQKGDKLTTIAREFSDDTFKMTITFGDIVCTRIYKAIS